MLVKSILDSQNSELMMQDKMYKDTTGNLALAFGISSSLFAVKLTDCKEVVEDYLFTPMPVKINLLKSIINLRGTLVPIINKGLLTDIPKKDDFYEFDTSKKVLIFEFKNKLFGVEVDFVRKEFFSTADIQSMNSNDIHITSINEQPAKFITSKWILNKLKDNADGD